MKLVLKTKVWGHHQNVMARFDQHLFEALKPPGVKMKIVNFTGCEAGDIVELNFLRPIRSKWISEIIEHGSDSKHSYFVDVGRVLPFPLRNWKHKHIVEKIDDENSYIIDDISYSTGFIIFDVFLYLPLLLSFYPRKKIYRNYFSKE